MISQACEVYIYTYDHCFGNDNTDFPNNDFVKIIENVIKSSTTELHSHDIKQKHHICKITYP